VTEGPLFEFESQHLVGTETPVEPMSLDEALRVCFSDEGERGEWRPRLALMEPGEQIWGMQEDGGRVSVRRVS
jgi:hypothetical protein